MNIKEIEEKVMKENNKYLERYGYSNGQRMFIRTLLKEVIQEISKYYDKQIIGMEEINNNLRTDLKEFERKLKAKDEEFEKLLDEFIKETGSLLILNSECNCLKLTTKYRDIFELKANELKNSLHNSHSLPLLTGFNEKTLEQENIKGDILDKNSNVEDTIRCKSGSVTENKTAPKSLCKNCGHHKAHHCNYGKSKCDFFECNCNKFEPQEEKSHSLEQVNLEGNKLIPPKHNVSSETAYVTAPKSFLERVEELEEIWIGSTNYFNKYHKEQAKALKEEIWENGCENCEKCLVCRNHVDKPCPKCQEALSKVNKLLGKSSESQGGTN